MSNKERWAGKVAVAGLERPWWRSANTEAVARVNLAGVLAFDVHIVRGKSGKPFVTTPAGKKGDTWAPVLELVDDGLREAVTAAALAAFEGWEEGQAEANAVPF